MEPIIMQGHGFMVVPLTYGRDRIIREVELKAW